MITQPRIVNRCWCKQNKRCAVHDPHRLKEDVLFAWNKGGDFFLCPDTLCNRNTRTLCEPWPQGDRWLLISKQVEGGSLAELSQMTGLNTCQLLAKSGMSGDPVVRPGLA
jgi:hypothetical protein